MDDCVCSLTTANPCEPPKTGEPIGWLFFCSIHGYMKENTKRCAICHEPIVAIGPYSWAHAHGDFYCGTGDGSTAYPQEETK